jgi:cytidylate kinase
MKGTSRTIERIVEEQVQRWQLMRTEEKKPEADLPVATISREPGSGGSVVGARVAQQLGFDLFHREMINQMAQSARVSARILETLDEKALSTLENWIASLVDDQHLWPDQYLQHLMKVIGAIGRHGRAVIVGRGANYILPSERRFRVRIIAPLRMRIENVSRKHGVSFEEARRHVLRTESHRKSFVHKYFHRDVADPLCYDLILNMESLDIEAAVRVICSCIGGAV